MAAGQAGLAQTFVFKAVDDPSRTNNEYAYSVPIDPENGKNQIRDLPVNFTSLGQNRDNGCVCAVSIALKPPSRPKPGRR